MSYAAIAALVLGCGALAGLLSWWARRLFRFETLRRHHEIGGQVFLQLGVIFAVLLAFVFNEVWGEYNTAANALSQECADLHGVAILAAALEPPAQQSVQGQLETYMRAVIQDEWSAMKHRRRSSNAEAVFSELWVGIAHLPPADADVRGRLLAQIATAHEWRETRLFQVHEGVPVLMWVLLIGMSAVLVGFLLCFGVEYIGSQVVFTAVFAASLAFTLALIRTLDYPFEGALRLQPTAFQETLQKVAALRGD